MTPARSAGTDAGKTLACNLTSPATVVCLLYGMNKMAIPEGAVANIQITVSPSTQNASTAVYLSAGVAADSEGFEIPPMKAMGSFVPLPANAPPSVQPGQLCRS